MLLGAYNNQYWPAKYLIDIDGRVRYFHFGEGKYEETDKVIQELLNETGKNVDENVDVCNFFPNRNITLETYLRNWRMQYFYPDGNLSEGEQSFTLQTNYPEKYFILWGGTWEILYQHSKAVKNAILEENLIVRSVFLVMRSNDDKPKKVKVFLNRKDPGQVSGKDVLNGEVIIDSDKLYELISLPEVENRKLGLEFEYGVEISAFTFGS